MGRRDISSRAATVRRWRRSGCRKATAASRETAAGKSRRLVPQTEVRPEPAPRSGFQRSTICVSSQVGCAVNCHFCLTAQLGLKRNLSAGEIAGQVVAVLARHAVEIGRDRINLVFMGMGEPFLNYDEFMAAVRLLVGQTGIAESRMTVSTSGIVPGILRFAQEPVRPKLAISLNASNDRVREAIMPVTRKWRIEEVMHAACELRLRPRERVTFEYVLLGGVNDSLEHAEELARLVRRVPYPCQGQSDRVESRSRDPICRAVGGQRGSVSEESHRGGNSGIRAPATGAGYLCSLRPVEAYPCLKKFR